MSQHYLTKEECVAVLLRWMFSSMQPCAVTRMIRVTWRFKVLDFRKAHAKVSVDFPDLSMVTPKVFALTYLGEHGILPTREWTPLAILEHLRGGEPNHEDS